MKKLLINIGKKSKKAFTQKIETKIKDKILKDYGELIKKNKKRIIEENKKDIINAYKKKNKKKPNSKINFK